MLRTVDLEQLLLTTRRPTEEAGALRGCWVPHEIRDQVVDFVGYWSQRAGIPAYRMARRIGILPSKSYNWKGRYGEAWNWTIGVPRLQ